MTPQSIIQKAFIDGLISLKPPRKTGRPIVHHDYTHVKQRLCMARLRAARRQRQDAA